MRMGWRKQDQRRQRAGRLRLDILTAFGWLVRYRSNAVADDPFIVALIF